MNNCKKHNMELKEKKQKIQIDNLIMGKKATGSSRRITEEAMCLSTPVHSNVLD